MRRKQVRIGPSWSLKSLIVPQRKQFSDFARRDIIVLVLVVFGTDWAGFDVAI
jgi:hypothetical protein